jgi:hypothetical protein
LARRFIFEKSRELTEGADNQLQLQSAADCNFEVGVSETDTTTKMHQIAVRLTGNLKGEIRNQVS